ncbi:uncharacterized protein RAG0_06152 [Rhynchosporium agropyri]|uniref:Uncharacterized protein n=1 Tax=Rhynchosporium agropyri TaxID=914238 RepID=A0A1E1KJS1_9HELO|nr:uncharacterized protein RAG0_06152 [Rhynchosporium agropyri]
MGHVSITRKYISFSRRHMRPVVPLRQYLEQPGMQKISQSTPLSKEIETRGMLQGLESDISVLIRFPECLFEGLCERRSYLPQNREVDSGNQTLAKRDESIQQIDNMLLNDHKHKT